MRERDRSVCNTVSPPSYLIEPYAFLWHSMHCMAVGALLAALAFFTSAWQPVHERWNACWFVSVINAVLLSCLICGMAGMSFGVAPSRAWQSAHFATPATAASLSKSSLVSVVVLSAGHAVFSGGIFAASVAGWAV